MPATGVRSPVGSVCLLFVYAPLVALRLRRKHFAGEADSQFPARPRCALCAGSGGWVGVPRGVSATIAAMEAPANPNDVRRPPLLGTLAGIAAAVCAVAFAGVLSYRTLSSLDLGYHLRYGREGIVDTNPWLYTLPAPGLSPSVRPQPGPGCWYDAEGRYRFANANWGTQIVMAGVERWAGPGGLCGLRVALVLTIALLGLLTLRRLGVPWAWAAMAVLLLWLTAQERITLRPELFGYALLAGELFVLCRPRWNWATGGALLLLQLALVNTHSYWLLGLGLTGAFLADRALRVLWGRMRPPTAPRGSRRARPTADADHAAEPLPERGRALRWAGLVLLGQVVLSFANPWTWRGALLPIQTLLFLRANHVVGEGHAGQGHPWATIGEFHRPFVEAYLDRTATYAFVAVLVLFAAGILAGAMRRRWALVLVLLGVLAVSLSMRRNIAPAAIVGVPVAMGAILGRRKDERTAERRGHSDAARGGHLPDAVGGRWETTRRWGARETAETAVAGAAILLAGGLSWWVASNGFYFHERSPVRFGCGYAPLVMPLDTMAWLNEHVPPSRGGAAVRLWTDYNGSSNLSWFRWQRDPQAETNILTNTWAYPPAVMEGVLATARGAVPFAPVAGEFGVDAVAVQVDQASDGLVGRLMQDPGWALVHVGASHVLFLPAERAAAIPGARALTEESFDAAAHARSLAQRDALPAHALMIGGMTVYRLRWFGAAAELFQEAVRRREDYAEAWILLGQSLHLRGLQRLYAGQAQGRADLEEAVRALQRATALRPDDAAAGTRLRRAQSDLEQIRRGMLPGS